MVWQETGMRLSYMVNNMIVDMLAHLGLIMYKSVSEQVRLVIRFSPSYCGLIVGWIPPSREL